MKSMNLEQGIGVMTLRWQVIVKDVDSTPMKEWRNIGDNMKAIINEIKDDIKYMNMVMDLKKLSIYLPLFIVATTAYFFFMFSGAISYWWIAPIIITVLPIILLAIRWLTEVKPIVEEAKREVELEKKYSWIYNRFTKREVE